MKRFIILGAGKNKNIDSNPSYLIANTNQTFLNWQIESSKVLRCDRVDYVGGYQLDTSDTDLFSSIHLTLNTDWDKTNSLYSLLLLDFDENHDLYISYNDILLRDSFLKELFTLQNSRNIVALIDETFPARYQKYPYNCETLDFFAKESEFIGFIFIPKHLVKELIKLKNHIEDYSKYSLSDLMRKFNSEKINVDLIEASTNWCDANFPGALPQFILCGKAQALSNLKKLVKQSCFLNQTSFSSFEWEVNPQKVYKKTLALIDSHQVAIRSSASNEDGFLHSNAGAYQSHLGVNIGNYEEFTEAVDKTIESYKNGYSISDLVLIQPYVSNAYLHGVVFTKNHNGGPYYVFNYAYGSDTSAITSGYSSDFKTFYFFRGANKKLLPEDLKGVYKAIQEIEQVLDYDSLDIEFLLDNDKKCYILQVRPQVSYKHESTIKDLDVAEAIKTIKEKLTQENKSTKLFPSTQSVFAVMPDWNPAEIIGRKPLQLACSLYEEIITNEIWAKQRSEFGYYNLGKYTLMKSFFCLPYIDVKASFLSFIPASVDCKLALKIVEKALYYLRKNPHLHDKIEFDVVPTCYQFDFDEKYKHIFDDFDSIDYADIKDKYKKLTANAILFDSKESHFHPIEEQLSSDPNNIIRLLENAKVGALAFAHEARKAFIATILLKSLVQVNALSQDELDNFYQSLCTVSKKFSKDAYLCKVGKMQIEKFVEKYGHLRPGTYDITAPRYDSDLPTFILPIIEKARDFDIIEIEWKIDTINKIDSFLRCISKNLNFKDFIVFCKNSIVSREKVKFDFTKDISNALEKIALFAEEKNINRQEIAFCDFGFLKVFLKNKTLTKTEKEVLDFVIMQNKKIHNLIKKIELPIILFNEQDVDAFYQPDCQPNFVTSKKAMAEIVVMTSNFKDDLTNKAVLIENADPGYEWLFSEDITSLITMYGGMNSHMAVRAAELNIPSVIGVGEKKFKEIASWHSIMIDCLNKKLTCIQ